MGDLLLLLLGAGLTSNLALTYLLGWSPGPGMHRDTGAVRAVALGTPAVLTATAVAFWLVDRAILAPRALGYLRMVAFVLFAAVLAQGAAQWLQRRDPALHERLRGFPLLVVANCGVLGVAVLEFAATRGLFGTLVFAAATAGGFGLVLVLFSGLQQRLEYGDVPLPFRGLPLALLSAGLTALGLLGLAGIAP